MNIDGTGDHGRWKRGVPPTAQTVPCPPPEALPYADFGDFALWRFKVGRASFVRGFGRPTNCSEAISASRRSMGWRQMSPRSLTA